ncbi:MAG: hypothetical protein ACNS62_24920 [Candidatus Cyclobacteriaceae bacterium M3_2C_046]
MKTNVLTFLIPLILTFSEAGAQMLVNSQPDSLQERDKFYYNHLNRPKKVHLDKGIYFLIFDVSVNSDSVKLSLNRKNQPPVLYQRNNGYFTIMCNEQSYPEFRFDYPNRQDDMKLLAKLYKIPENIIGSELPSTFKITDIYGNEFTRASFNGYTSIFFSSLSYFRHDIFSLIDEIKRNYSYDSLKLVFIDKALPADLHNFKVKQGYDDIIFVSDHLAKLRPWTSNLVRRNPGAIIFISDEKTGLLYRNVLDLNFIKDDHDLKTEITEVLQSIL